MSAFNKLAAQLAQRPGVTNPRGLAYAIGARKYGKAEMQRRAAKGRHKHALARAAAGRHAR